MILIELADPAPARLARIAYNKKGNAYIFGYQAVG